MSLSNPIKGFSASGEIGLAGKFEITLVPVGDYRVSISPPMPKEAIDPELLPETTSDIPVKYQNAETSGLQATVPDEGLLDRVAKADPEDSAILERRAFLYGLTGRSQKAEPLRLELVRRGIRTWTILWLLCLGDDALENTEFLAEVDESESDPLSLLAVARRKSERGDPEKARTLLRRAIELGAPAEAVVAAGRLSRESANDNDAGLVAI